jgi:hypothetical protein
VGVRADHVIGFEAKRPGGCQLRLVASLLSLAVFDSNHSISDSIDNALRHSCQELKNPTELLPLADDDASSTRRLPRINCHCDHSPVALGK